ncbi:DUF3347 domain-containing protein [Flavobacterium sp. LS1R49]|uniref:DUF3347 domain-containing protein n=1 Tax=Flavobacterium shii TaxID=2987687 RepID=A0A9X2ZLE9_9FLAO|nr:DUF3347 domain-containing protein [Flavobacterium shii]MCV9929753.1 DUF3347 domain-containing protein [Flavobacterium shii]
MKKNLLILAISLLGYAGFAQNTDTLLSKYYSIKNALVKSDARAASEAIINLQKEIKAEDAFKEKNDLNTAVDKLAKANSIEKQRAVFNDVSIAMWQLVSSTEKVSQPVYYQYCPMKKAYWLSSETVIKNPYFGSAMLTCGNVFQTKK